MAEQDSTSTAVAVREHAAPARAPIMSGDEVQATFRIAAALAQSGMFKDVTQAEQAFGRILLGRDLGLSPTQALMSIDVVKGNVQMRGVLLLSFVRKSEDYDYAVTEHTNEAATIEIRRRVDGEWQAEGSERFTIEDAKRAGLVKAQSAWEAHPGNMCLWRAASNAVKFFAPDLLGGIPVYTEGDTLIQTPNLAAGEGSGDEPGWGSVPIAAVHEVEKIIRRAAKLGHAGLQSRAAIQMMLSGQPDATVQRWINEASAELDALQAKGQVERGEKPKRREIRTRGEAEGEAEAYFRSLPGDVVWTEDDFKALVERLVAGEAVPPLPGEVTYATPQEQGTPQPEGVDDDGSPLGDTLTDAEAARADAEEEATFEPAPQLDAELRGADLPPQTQLELAKARLGAAQNDREEREARAEVERLRGQQ